MKNIEIIAVEFHQIKRKWLLLYNPPSSQSDLDFIHTIINVLNHFSQLRKFPHYRGF